MFNTYEHNAQYVRAQFLINIFDSNFKQNDKGLVVIAKHYLRFYNDIFILNKMKTILGVLYGINKE